MNILDELKAERDRLDRAIAALEGDTKVKRSYKRKKRGKLSAAQRKLISNAMKKSWAKRKNGK